MIFIVYGRNSRFNIKIEFLITFVFMSDIVLQIRVRLAIRCTVVQHEDIVMFYLRHLHRHFINDYPTADRCL